MKTKYDARTALRLSRFTTKIYFFAWVAGNIIAYQLLLVGLDFPLNFTLWNKMDKIFYIVFCMIYSVFILRQWHDKTREILDNIGDDGDD